MICPGTDDPLVAPLTPLRSETSLDKGTDGMYTLLGVAPELAALALDILQ